MVNGDPNQPQDHAPYGYYPPPPYGYPPATPTNPLDFAVQHEDVSVQSRKVIKERKPLWFWLAILCGVFGALGVGYLGFRQFGKDLRNEFDESRAKQLEVEIPELSKQIQNRLDADPRVIAAKKKDAEQLTKLKNRTDDRFTTVG